MKWLFWLLPLCSCASLSSSSDIQRIRELTTIETLPLLVNNKVEVQTETLLKSPLDIETAVRIALLNNRKLRAALRDLGIVRGQLLQAGLIANPTFEIEFLPERNSNLELRLEYNVTSLILAPIRAKALTYELEAERAQTAGAVLQLGYEVRVAFYALQAAQQRFKLSEQALQAYAASRDAAVALLTAGNIKDLNAATHITAYERARVTTSELELEVHMRREQLQRLLGIQTTLSWHIEETLQEIPETLTFPEKAETLVLEKNLDLLAMRQSLQAFAKQTTALRTQGFLPEINADVHSLSGVRDSSNDRTWRFGGGLNFSIPLFDRQQGNIQMYQSKTDATLERYYGIANDLQSVWRQTQQNVSSAHLRARQFQTIILPAQAKVVEQTLLQYNAMQLSVFELLQAKRDQFNLELDYLQTLSEYFCAQAKLHTLFLGHLPH